MAQPDQMLGQVIRGLPLVDFDQARSRRRAQRRHQDQPVEPQMLDRADQRILAFGLVGVDRFDHEVIAAFAARLDRAHLDARRIRRPGRIVDSQSDQVRSGARQAACGHVGLVPQRGNNLEDRLLDRGAHISLAIQHARHGLGRNTCCPGNFLDRNAQLHILIARALNVDRILPRHGQAPIGTKGRCGISATRDTRYDSAIIFL